MYSLTFPSRDEYATRPPEVRTRTGRLWLLDRHTREMDCPLGISTPKTLRCCLRVKYFRLILGSCLVMKYSRKSLSLCGGSAAVSFAIGDVNHTHVLSNLSFISWMCTGQGVHARLSSFSTLPQPPTQYSRHVAKSFRARVELKVLNYDNASETYKKKAKNNPASTRSTHSPAQIS
jgi:hypothetical protein